MNEESKIILALDFDEVSKALAMIEKTSEFIKVYKLGLEFYLANGKSGVMRIMESFPEIEIFLDLKLHDIPNTVSKAAQSVAPLAPKFLTVHASGGSEMIKQAVAALPNTEITAVTVLTSLDEVELQAMGVTRNPIDYAVTLASNAVQAGAKAVVCSPLEVAAIRNAVGDSTTLITPGVRPSGADSADQKRTATALQAVEAGADLVVVGRPITQADNPYGAAKDIFESLQ